MRLTRITHREVVMSTRWLVGACVAALAVTVSAQEAKQPAMDPQMKAMMETMEKYSTPGPEHERLHKGNGTWDVTSKMWMDPAGEPMMSTGVSTQRSILGGRFVQYDFEGSMMGMPFTGFGISGYDRYNRTYKSLWLDTMGTGFYLTEGTCDAAGKVCTETGVWDDCMAGTKMNVRLVTTHLNDDTFTMEMFGGPVGTAQEAKMMELTYTRRK
jgi:hypothetical protein